MKGIKRFRTINVLLGLVIVVLVNLVSTNSFFRLDLTTNDSYSLSPVSQEALARVEDPLRVKVFYNETVPAPYNGVRQYLLDMLREYDNATDQLFTYEVVDTTDDAGREQARGYGLRQVEIQEFKSDEFASRAIYMGMVVIYGDVVEVVDQLTSTTGLEYRITTAMRSAIAQGDNLSGTTDRVQLQVLASPEIAEIQIQGFHELETQMVAIHERINKDNYGRIEYAYVEPSGSVEIARLTEELGVEPLEWSNAQGARIQGLLEVVLRYQDRIRRIPIGIRQQLFGGYVLDSSEMMEEAIREGLKSLVNPSTSIAYSTTAGEKSLYDSQTGAGPFRQLIDGAYEPVEIDLAREAIPAGIDTLVLNGPTKTYSQTALYRIDQFLMRGGSLFVMVDRQYNEQLAQQQYMATPPKWEVVTTGVEALLEHWGAEVTSKVVADEESYVSRQPQGQRKILQAPVIQPEGINRELVVTRQLNDLIVLSTSEILPTIGDSDDDEHDVTYIPVLTTSPRSWVEDNPDMIGDWLTEAPASADLGARDVAVLLEGRFTSYFREAVDIAVPSVEEEEGDNDQLEGEVPSEPVDPVTPVSIDRYRSQSIAPGKVFIVSTSEITTGSLLNPEYPNAPNATFLLNALDYLNGAPAVAELRSKGLGIPRIGAISSLARVVARWLNVILVPLVVAVVGMVVWSRRRARSRAVMALFRDNGEES